MVAGRGNSNSGKGNERFRITVSPPVAELERMLKQLGQDVVDYRPVYPRLVDEVMAPGIQAAFASKGATLGQAWPPLTARYARRKLRAGSSEMLSLTGQLRSSFAMLRSSKRSVSYGTTVPYARAVQYGHRRRFVGWSTEMRDRATAVLQQYHEQLVQKAARALEAKKGAQV